MRKKTKIKLCPFLDRDCEEKKCALYNERFDRCEWGLMTYNLWLVSENLKTFLEKK